MATRRIFPSRSFSWHFRLLSSLASALASLHTHPRLSSLGTDKPGNQPSQHRGCAQRTTGGHGGTQGTHCNIPVDYRNIVFIGKA
ncbi:hypothetical protein GGR56DRAFT_465084 [Xylariaceae sp. FL0804]|nr:hypothetical protein GGR56DRAFT_465084 [Xylariaceae sp. FL0804]